VRSAAQRASALVQLERKGLRREIHLVVAWPSLALPPIAKYARRGVGLAGDPPREISTAK
jgi:hypothetical protein